MIPPFVPRFAIGLGLAVLLAGTSDAQRPIFIVDASGGPGSHFNDLPAAVAAVPDGAVLRVRTGIYSPFSVSGKGLSIVGDVGSGAVLWDGNVVISNSSSSQTFLVKNVVLGSPFGSSVSVQHAKGVVIFENITSRPALLAQPAFVVVSSDDVRFHRCSLSPAPSPLLGNVPILATDSTVCISHSRLEGDENLPALRIERSRALVVKSSLTGGEGTAAYCPSLGIPGVQPSPGAAGVFLVDNSTLISLRTAVVGGSGGQGGCGWVQARGGAGVSLGTRSRAYFEGASPLGGPGTPAGPSYGLTLGGTIQINANSTPSSGEILGEQEIGKTIKFALDGKPISIGALVFATQPTLVPLEPLTLGSFLSGWSVTFPVLVPVTGVLELPFVIPTTYPLGETYYWQFLTVEPGLAALWATNSFLLHVNR